MLDHDPEIGHKVVKWMSTKGIAKKCSLCSGEAFAVGPICALPARLSGGNDQTFAVYPVVCRICAHTIFLAANIVDAQ